MYDPFLIADPPVLMHEASGPEFERAWSAQDSNEIPCPICGEGPSKNAESPLPTAIREPASAAATW